MSTEPLMTCLGLPGRARDGAVATEQLSVTITFHTVLVLGGDRRMGWGCCDESPVPWVLLSGQGRRGSMKTGDTWGQ